MSNQFLRNFLGFLRFIHHHPLCRDSVGEALGRWIRWQLGSRLLLGPVLVPFANGTSLLVDRGMTGATGNVYVGLHEYPSMAFLLHYLRLGDLFVDGGANVGTYTVLAAGGCRAKVTAIEPISSARLSLRRNIGVNDLYGYVTVIPAALGDRAGTVRMTSAQDTMNHVVSREDSEASSVEVPMVTLDSVMPNELVRLLKLDLEGFEGAALLGARELMESKRVSSIILETNGSARRYDHFEEAAESLLVRAGYQRTCYQPVTRALVLAEGPMSDGNSIFVLDIEDARARVKSGNAIDVLGVTI